MKCRNTLLSTAYSILLTIMSLGSFLSDTQAQDVLTEKPHLSKRLFNQSEKLFRLQCTVCHGDYGKGDGKAAFLLYPKPRDFTENKFRLISTTDMQARDEDLFKVISHGMPGSAMPPWEFLTEDERWGLVYYVRYLINLEKEQKMGKITKKMIQEGLLWKLQKELSSNELNPETVIQIPEEPKITKEDIKQGEVLYIKACASCHGSEGRGDGQTIMKDSKGFPIQPRDLTSGIFKGSSSSEDLYYRIVGGLPGSPMPSYQGVFKDKDIWNLIHFVQTLPRPGEEERAKLHRHKIVAHKTNGYLNVDPLDERWQAIEPVFVSLMPLWWRDDRIEGVEVRARHDGYQIEILLSWSDETVDVDTVSQKGFSDGAAVQLSDADELPLFAMGSTHMLDTIWFWKASWQEDLKQWVDVEDVHPNMAVDWYESQKNYKHGNPFEAHEAKTQFQDSLYLTGWGAGNPLSNPNRETASEEDHAKGFGTLTTTQPVKEPVESKGIWKEGKWHLVFKSSLNPSEKMRIQFSPGQPINISFAVWDGAKEDRDGQKAVSIWNDLILEP